MSRNIQLRVPESFSTGIDIPNGVWAWSLNEIGDLVPSGATGITDGQAWEYVSDDLVPTGDAITEDPYWEYDESGNLVAKSFT
jgi:hypothetical protein